MQPARIAKSLGDRLVRCDRHVSGRIVPGWMHGRIARPGLPVVALVLAVGVGACAAGPAPTGPIVAGTEQRPREVNVIAFEYSYSPSVLELVPGETVLLHVVDAGLDTHEVVIGDGRSQAAWEQAEATAPAAPPGQSPSVSVPPALAGLRMVVSSGQRQDVLYHVPVASTPLIVGCHIPGHWTRGMQIPVRFVASATAASGG